MGWKIGLCCMFAMALACGGGGGGGSTTEDLSTTASTETIAASTTGASSSAETVAISGVVTDDVVPMANVEVYEIIDGREVLRGTAIADDRGSYVLELPVDEMEENHLLVLKAKGVGQQSHVTLNNLLGTLPDSMRREKGSVYESLSFNITHVSTAQWHLVQEENKGVYPNTQSELDASIANISDRVVDLAARIKLVADDPDFTPEDGEDVVGLLTSDLINSHLISRDSSSLDSKIAAMVTDTISDPAIDWERNFDILNVGVINQNITEVVTVNINNITVIEQSGDADEEDEKEGRDQGDDPASQEDINQEGTSSKDQDHHEDDNDKKDPDSSDDEGKNGDSENSIDDNPSNDEPEDSDEDNHKDSENGDNSEANPSDSDDDDGAPSENTDSSDSNEGDENGSENEARNEDDPTDEDDSNGESTVPPRLFDNPTEKARFLARATFGTSDADMDNPNDVSTWLRDQFEMAPSNHLPVTASMPTELVYHYGPAFWIQSITAPDQLRQRVAFALSQILVVSDSSNDEIGRRHAMASYYDILLRHAFGNYRELLEDVTWSPTMGHFLTYLGSRKANPRTGRQPDENYARELLQLFTIGLVHLNMDGTPALDENGQEMETYTNADITGLAKVFTGLEQPWGDGSLYFPHDHDEDVEEEPLFHVPMVVEEWNHSDREKAFLGSTIPENTEAEESIERALDIIFDHPNVAPFVCRQLIQRLVRSNPSPQYVERVSRAFERGHFTLPDGSRVGSTERGDLMATVAAILLDQDVLDIDATTGKIREPILRFTHWARAFNASPVLPQYSWEFQDNTHAEALGQHPLRAPSVFNFNRPGFVAPGSASGNAGLVAPELQNVNASSIPGVINYMENYIYNHHNDPWHLEHDLEELNSIEGVDIDDARRFDPDYSTELRYANDPEALVKHLNAKLCHGTLTESTRDAITEAISWPIDEDEDLLERVHQAIHLILSTPDYMVQP